MEKAKILLADDEEAFIRNIAKLITRKGHEIRTVSDEEGLIQALERNDFDVVILGAKIPRRDYPGTLKTIKKNRPEVEIILLTGPGSSESWNGEVHGEVFDVIRKPVRLEELLETIKEAFQKRCSSKNRPGLRVST